MKRKRKSSLQVMALTAMVFSLSVTSCVDDDYDLSKDIDLTVTVGGNLTIPGSGTELIRLSQLLDLEENSIVKADANGNYALYEGDSTQTDVTVDAIIFTEANINTEETPETLYMPAEATELLITNQVMNFFTLDKQNVTSDVTELNSVLFDSAEPTLTIYYTSTATETLVLKQGFEIKLELAGQTKDNTIGFRLQEGFSTAFEMSEENDQTLVLSQDYTLTRGDTLKIPLLLYLLQNFPKGQGLSHESATGEGHFYTEADIVFNGTISVPSSSESLTEITFHTKTSFPPGHEIAIESFTGKVDPKIDITIDPILVEGVPEYLQDSVNWDISNPYILLVVENPMPVPVDINAACLSTLKEGSTLHSTYIGNNYNNDRSIRIKANATTTYYISRVRMGNAPNNIVLGDDMYHLVQYIPEEIRLTDIDASAADEEVTLTVGANGAEFLMETSYELIAPLQFDKNTSIVYHDTVNEWGDDIEDITIKEAIITATAENGIPLDFNLSAEAINIDGETDPNITVEVVGGYIAAGNSRKSETMTVSHVEFHLTCTTGYMKDFDGLNIRFNAVSPADKSLYNVTLNENMVLRLTDISIAIVDGLTIDLNSDDD